MFLSLSNPQHLMIVRINETQISKAKRTENAGRSGTQTLNRSALKFENRIIR
jgi:hypothetical protein